MRRKSSFLRQSSGQKKKVEIGQFDLQVPSHYSLSSSISTVRASRYSFMVTFTSALNSAVGKRNAIKVLEDVDGEYKDVTPKDIAPSDYLDKFRILSKRSRNFLLMLENIPQSLKSTQSTRSTRVGFGYGGMKISMEDILAGIGSAHFIFDETLSLTSLDLPLSIESVKYTLPYIKITLRKTECFLLYEQTSSSELRETEEGLLAEEDNKQYEYLTTGKGKIRRRSEAECQTDEVLCKSRIANTVSVHTDTVGTYVSYFEMFDTYTELAKTRDTIAAASMETIPSNLSIKAQYAAIINLPSFKHASMIVRRLLSGNEYEVSQRRFRNMNVPHMLTRNIQYRYAANVIFRYAPQTLDNQRRAVADMSFCCNNGDILAVAYGLYSFSAMHVPNSGYVCIWSIKNPVGPERYYCYTSSVVSVEFSPYVQSLLAIGLYDGTVEVRDITKPNAPPLAVSQRISSPGCEPVMAIKWIKQSESTETSEIDPFLSLSQDGTVTKFRIINSPYLLGFKQMVLERIEGDPEGLPGKSFRDVSHQANRHPQGLNMTKHPLYPDIYYVLTDEGCLHKCSTNYPHQYLEVLKTHDGPVNTMDFSPWSPKVFLTCGNDWCVRIWVEGIFKPLITLKSVSAPVHCAYWSRTHSTVIVAVNRKSFNIWDIRRNILNPMSSHELDSSFNTLAKWAKCGYSIGVGNERGNLLMTAIDDMPFPPHFQYDELEKALFKAVVVYQDLTVELKSIGYFGYPHKRYVNPN